MARQDINHGTVAGDGTGENLFDAFEKANANFTELYQKWLDLADTGTGNGASDVGIEDSAGNFTAINVEAALAEIIADYAATSVGNGAAKIGVNDVGGYFANTTVEGVLQEFRGGLASVVTGFGASWIGVEDADGQLTATHAEAALEEVAKFAMPTAAPSSSLSLEFGAVTGTSSTLPTNSGAVRLHALGDCLVAFGDETVVANAETSLYMAAGSEVFGAPAGATHIAVKGVGEQGMLSVTGLDAAHGMQLTTNAVLPVQAGSSNAALPSGRMVRLFAMTDCYIAFGDSSVTADSGSLFFAAGTEVMRVPSTATHIAAMRYALDGGLYISGVN